ncbi:hypothetical protein [Streptomyces sp. NPDC058657]|uniref:hypothetical protein n=1 Tax=unclassified Streptomyces TaxID=2593676 RepID=UPI0036656367
MHALPSQRRHRAIEEIVIAVREGHEHRIAVLLEKFTEDADLPSLLALRQALEISRQLPPPAR